MAQGPAIPACRVSRWRRAARGCVLAVLAAGPVAGLALPGLALAAPPPATSPPAGSAATVTAPASGPAPASFGIEPLAPTAGSGGPGAADDPRAGQYIIETIRPGTVLSRAVQVSADTAEPLPLSVYPAGAGLVGGVFQFAPGRTANDLSRWTTLDRSAVAPSRDSPVTVRVTIAVPRDAMPGERYAVVWVESTGATLSPDGPAGEGIRTVNRAGVRMYVDVPPVSAALGARSAGGAGPAKAPVEAPGSGAASLVPVLVAAIAALVLAGRFATGRRRARHRPDRQVPHTAGPMAQGRDGEAWPTTRDPDR